MSLRTKNICIFLYFCGLCLPSLTVSSPVPDRAGAPFPRASPSVEFSPFLEPAEDLVVLFILRLGMPIKRNNKINITYRSKYLNKLNLEKTLFSSLPIKIFPYQRYSMIQHLGNSVLATFC